MDKKQADNGGSDAVILTLQEPSDHASTIGGKLEELSDKGEVIVPSRTEYIGPKGDKTEQNEGFWAWATVVSAFIIQSTGFGWIGSTQTFMMLAAGIFTGRLFDKGYCYHLVISGSIVLVFSLFMLSLTQPEQYYQVFLAQGLGVGLGSSLSYLPSLAIIAQHFPVPHARARAMGIAAAGSSLGGLIHPIMLNSLFHGKTGFANGVRASAGLLAGMQIIAVALMRTKYPVKNEADKEDGRDFRKATNIVPMVLRFATDWPYVSFVFGMAFMDISFFFPSFYIQLDAIEHGLDATFAFYSLSILNGLSFIGRLVPGFLARTLGVANMFLFSTIGTTLVIFCMLAVRNTGSVASFAAFYGFFSGALISLMSPMLAILADNPSEIGARMGMCFAIAGLGCLIGSSSFTLVKSDYVKFA
ncbi:hypothetical protein EW145_g2707 [Phellinidium pouzarii]|uniref:Major facilitator superfamily (MFS) profile domain-containing protein n=1 Tax=Phellinidium pouzarii TaxID=167371 RepID=A0A4S4LAB5_9AGAM|nr:hypothetical protein EW145_g2707 [Phellinidium pouzarii]